MRLKALIALAGVIALALAGCGGDDDDSGGGEASADSGETGGTIGISYPTVEGPWFTAALYGMTDEAESHDYDTVILSAGGYENVDTQVSQMANLVQQDVSAILMAAADPAALAPEIQSAMDAGIPVIAAGEENEGVVSSVTSSHCLLGQEMAEGAREALPEGGNLAALKGPAGAFWTEERWSCFAEELDGSGIEVVAEQSSEPSVTEGLRIAEDMIQRFDDLDLFYGVDDTVGVGAAQAIEQGPGCDEVDVVTSILGPEAQRMIEAGCIDYLVAQQVVEIGRESVRTAISAVEGEDVEPLVEIPNVIVTPENVDEIDIEPIRQPEGWRPDVS